MATRKAIDVLRRRRGRGQGDIEHIENLKAPPGEGPRHTAALNELGTILRHAVSTLPKRESLVFCLRHFDDCSYEQIARQLGTNVSSVGDTLHRAHKRLRTRLEPLLRPEPAFGASAVKKG